MTDMNGTGGALSRRGLLRLGACAAGAAVAGVAMSDAALAEIDSVIVKKTTKSKSDYKEAVNGPNCSGCWHFRSPNSCRVVEGVDNGNGRCDLYVSKQHMASR
jgi:hypothetical protein